MAKKNDETEILRARAMTEMNERLKFLEGRSEELLCQVEALIRLLPKEKFAEFDRLAKAIYANADRAGNEAVKDAKLLEIAKTARGKGN